MPLYIDQHRIQSLGTLSFFAKQVVEGFITGLHKSPYHGFSVEFAEHRLYNPGESTRNIDWKLYGRTDKLFVKRFEEETNLRCQLVIDCSHSMYYPVEKSPSLDAPNKIYYAVHAAAALMYLLRRQRDAVGLSSFSGNIEQTIKSKSSASHIQHLFGILEDMLQTKAPAVGQKTSAAEALHYIADTIHKRSLVIIFSDMFDQNQDTDAIFHALQHLKHNMHEVILFHTVHKASEIDFKFENRPYRFVDVESGEELKVNASEIRNHYLATISDFTEKLRLKCAQYRIELVQTDINNGFEQILLPFLVKRAKLY
ncbi:MAG: DUF58 domain-containing protein [Bacteroidales bacterium]|nr:DUF58 domain-containing protein [Bacteroidales bacterium]